MRALTDEETKILFTKLASYCGSSLNSLIAPDPSNPSAPQYTFRLHNSRVYYGPTALFNLSISIPRSSLLSVGTCLGRFTKSLKFRLHITALSVIAPHARYRIHVKPNGEMPFLYGGHVLKAHIGRWSEDIGEHQGVVVFSMEGERPVGFGITSRGTAEARKLEGTAVVVFRQGDVGEYLRDEDTLFTA